jgi:hypothetical protein
MTTGQSPVAVNNPVNASYCGNSHGFATAAQLHSYAKSLTANRMVRSPPPV